MHGVGGDALGGVDGGGVPEAGPLADVVGREAYSAVAAGVADGQVAVLAEVGDGPAVAVLNPIDGSKAQPSVVGPGDDHISDTGPVPVGQGHFGCGRGVIETMCAGTSVQFGD